MSTRLKFGDGTRKAEQNIMLGNIFQKLRDFAHEQPELVRFAVVGLLGYVAWHTTYSYYLRPTTMLDEYVIHSMVTTSEWIMGATGWEVLPPSGPGLRNTIGIINAGGVHVGDPCDGVVLFALFAVFLIAFPGPWRHKLWFIPLGVLGLHGVNILRVCGLIVIQWINPEWLQFNHDYTFTIIVYGVVFALWYLWAKLFVPVQSAKP